jgi:hypothetical protein
MREFGIHLDGVAHKTGDVGVNKHGEHNSNSNHNNGQAAAAFIAEQSF